MKAHEVERIRIAKGAVADDVEAQVPGFVWDRSDGWPQFGGAVPWQGWGTYRGSPCYLRFRHNQASIAVYGDEAREIEVLAAVIWPYFPDGHPDAHEHAGDLADDQVAAFVHDLVGRLAPVSETNPTSATLLARAVDELMHRTSGEPR